MKKNFYLLAFLMMPAIMCTSCIKPDPDEEVQLNENVETFNIDESFKAPTSFLQASWKGEYSGYDENQKANTNIRRLLELNSDGTYKNTIQGILVNSNNNKADYVNFEIEKGTYQYNGSNSITYYVQVDSLINYQTEELEYFSKKHSYSGSSTDTSKDVSSYTEGVQFQKKDNNHQWVTKDVYLSNLKGNDLELFFFMDKE